MNLIKKIEYNYHIKIINDLVINKKHIDINDQLNAVYKKSKKLYFQILKHFYPSLREISNTHNLFLNNIMFVNSFIEEDMDLIFNFLNYYFKEINFTKSYFSELSKELSYLHDLLSQNKILTFDDIIEISTLYQVMMSMNKSECLNIFKNEFAFFSTTNEMNFSDPNLIKCYFLVIDHPYNVYKKIKFSNTHDKFLSQNMMFNLDNSIIKKKYENVDVEITKKDWSTHTNSWSDPNVINSFKGMIISKEDLIEKSNEIFSSIILHMIQSGLDIQLDYKIIDSYCSQMKIDDTYMNTDISNNEKKFIQKSVKDIIAYLEFEL